jgi:Tfp pilus assembly pilus retraction ATPase PilT
MHFSRHIITIEEPIEFVHSNKRAIITQREVPEHATTFPIGLKAALREDADIVLVGEMRDLETIQLALTAAETGLLVFGTLHTNNARKTVDRMIDVFPATSKRRCARCSRIRCAESSRSFCSNAATAADVSRSMKSSSSTARPAPSFAKAPHKSSRT